MENVNGPGGNNPAIARARRLVLEHGWNSTSFQIVNPGIKRWFSAAGDAVVGYVIGGGWRVVAGAPVCEFSRLAAVTSEFETDAAGHGQKVYYFCAESRLEAVIAELRDHTKFLIGAQPTWDPADWAKIVSKHRSLRAQLNRARNKGVSVSEWPADAASNSPMLQDCLHAWLDSKGLPPLHFMVEPETLARLEHRRIFVAEHDGDVVGFAVLSPVAQRKGWLFEQFPHAPGAPNGTVELMIDSAMRALADDACDYATLGLSPLSKRAAVEPFYNPVWLRFVLGWLRRHGQRFYNFDGLDAFKAKLQPERWEPVFAISNEPAITVGALYAIASAFSGDAPVKMVIGGAGRALASEGRRVRRFLAGS
jgi:phosphatidylglycerol lysyltransferase